jgi:hypothetical protein
MATSTVLERRKIKDRQLSPTDSMMRDNESRSSTIFSGSSTTAVPTPSTESLVGSSERDPEKVRTFKSFKDWLGSFAPSSEISDTSDIQKNLEDLRSSDQELHGGDRHTKQPDLSRVEMPLGSREANAPKSKSMNLFNAKSFELGSCLGPHLLDKSKQIRLFIQGIQRPGSTEVVTEEVTIRPDAQVYQLLRELYHRGTCSIYCKYHY